LKLLASESVRLTRIAPRAIYKDDSGQLIVPIAPSSDLSEALRAFLEELRPAESVAVPA
jgi:hypothetical protein